jgi:hypothetical protein
MLDGLGNVSGGSLSGYFACHLKVSTDFQRRVFLNIPQILLIQVHEGPDYFPFLCSKFPPARKDPPS